jgi:hypothetical protein
LFFFTKPPLSASAKRHTPQTSNTTGIILEYFDICEKFINNIKAKLGNNCEKL